MNDLINEADLAYAAEVRRRDVAFDTWLKSRTSYRKSEIPAYIDAPTNEERSRAEVIEFLANPPQPGEPSYTAYISERNGKTYVTTFMGDVLAHVTSITRSRGVFGSRTSGGTFRATGYDGRRYYGTHNGVGMYCRLRARKGGAK